MHFSWIQVFLVMLILAAFIMSTISLVHHDNKTSHVEVARIVNENIEKAEISKSAVKTLTFNNGAIVPPTLSVTGTPGKLIHSSQVLFSDYENKTQANSGSTKITGNTITYTPAYYGAKELLDQSKHLVTKLAMTTVYGYPYIVYFDSVDNDLYGMRSTDTQGIEWNSAVLLVDNTDINMVKVISTSTRVVIVYNVVSSDNLLSLASDDRLGDTWSSNSAVTIATTSDNQSQFGVTNIGGLPTVSFGSTDDDTLSTAQATTTDVTAWSSVSTVSITAPSYCDAKTRSNKLEVATNSTEATRLKFVVSTNSAASSFETTVDITTGAITIQRVQLVYTDENKPVIFFYDATNNVLKQALSSTTDGLTAGDWTVSTIHSIGSDAIGSAFSAAFSSSQLSVSRAVIFVYNATKKQLVLLQSTDRTMATWRYETFVNNDNDDIGNLIESVMNANGQWLVTFTDNGLHDALQFINMYHETKVRLHWIESND